MIFLLSLLKYYWIINNVLHGAESFLRDNRFSASQEIPRVLWKPEVHYRTHNSPPTVPILRLLVNI